MPYDRPRDLGCPVRRFCRRGFVVVFVFFFCGGVLLCVLWLLWRRLRPCVGLCRVVLGVALLCGLARRRGARGVVARCRLSVRGGRRWFVRGVSLVALALGGRGGSWRCRGCGGRWASGVVVGGWLCRFRRCCRLRGGRGCCLRSGVLLLFGVEVAGGGRAACGRSSFFYTAMKI